MIQSYLKKNKTKAFHYGYRPEEIKQTETFNNSEVKFVMVSLAPQNLLQFSLGSDIIFNLLRKREDTYVDMSVLYDKNLLSLLRGGSITGLYSQQPIKSFDIVGLSLYFIGSFFNIVPFLLSSKIHPYQKKRNNSDPLIIGGGGAVSSNPEPVAEFFDIIIIGDGETPISLLIDFYKKNKSHGKNSLLRKIKDCHKSFYIPALKTEKTIVYFNTEDSIEQSILTQADYVSKPRNKVIELMRGCHYKCNFCQLGNIRDKVAIMPINKVIEAIKSYPCGTSIYPFAPDESSYKDYDKIYKNLGARKLYRYNQRFNTYSKQSRHSLNDYRVVFGLDGISQRLRDKVNKRIKTDEIYSTFEHAFKYFNVIKINLVIAYPFEAQEDWQEFDNLLNDLTKMRLEISPDKCLTEEENKRFNILYQQKKAMGEKCSLREIKNIDKSIMIHLAPTPFQAEPHTPMQWYGIGKVNNANRAIIDLQKKYMIKYGMVKIEGLNSKDSIETEFIIKRAGRELCDIFYEMGIRGYYNANGLSGLNGPLRVLLKRSGIDYKRYLRQIHIDEKLEWDFIKTGREDKYKKTFIEMLNLM